MPVVYSATTRDGKSVYQLECYLRTKDFSQINQKKLENMNNIS